MYLHDVDAFYYVGCCYVSRLGRMRVCMGERHAFSRWAATAMEHIEKAAQWGLAAAVAFWAAMPQLTQLLLLLMVPDTALVTRNSSA